MRFENHTIAITGAASGIGLATVEKLTGEGAHVIAVDRDDMPAAADAVSVVTGDVGDAAVLAAVAKTMAEHAGRGAALGLVTAAGISASGTALIEIEEARWDQVFEVNVKGTWLWLKALAPVMARAGGGSIVTVASQLAFAGGRNNAAYIASKGAIVALTKTAALELVGDDIRVNSVAPGATETPLMQAGMARAADPEAAREASRARHAMGRFGRSEEIAAAIAFLLSAESSFTTGTTLLADGGWLAA
jgi:NAD(P)-dependent dehydrogenase (short-subunit alcohol dehydrogenase family)